jgi:threonine dehydrogenase-like Zn-dependent dehydrogenase
VSLEIPSILERETREPNANHGWIFRQSKKVYKIKNLTDEEATLVEPASCAIHGLDKLNPAVGVEALIFGAGPTGELQNVTLHSD